jgi:hypothetical protein
MALYSFTNSNRYDSINYTDINAETLATVDSHSAGYSTADPDTTSGSPHFSCTQSYAATSRTSYCEIDLTPVSRLLFEPTHLKFYSRPGSSYSSGTIEATVIVNGSEYSMGTNTIGGTMSAYSFHVPESITTPVSSTMKFRIYYYIPGGSSLRLDDVEVIGFDKGYLAQQGDVIALYPITGNSLADTAGNSSVSASDITETNTASFFFNSSSTGSASGPPCIAATGFDGDAQDRYLSFTLSPEYLTAINFNVIQAYMRTGAGPGQIRGEIVDSSGSHSMGTYTISADMTQYIFAVPEDILDSVEETVEIRLYAWDFENSGATFRVDDISVEAVLINLPNPGTIILVQ